AEEFPMFLEGDRDVVTYRRADHQPALRRVPVLLDLDGDRLRLVEGLPEETDRSRGILQESVLLAESKDVRSPQRMSFHDLPARRGARRWRARHQPPLAASRSSSPQFYGKAWPAAASARQGRRHANPQPPVRQSAGDATQGVATSDVPSHNTPDLPRICLSDPDLARIVSAWPDLPEAVKRAVVALVDTVRRAR